MTAGLGLGDAYSTILDWIGGEMGGREARHAASMRICHSERGLKPRGPTGPSGGACKSTERGQTAPTVCPGQRNLRVAKFDPDLLPSLAIDKIIFQQIGLMNLGEKFSLLVG